jgi:hypothetical protein
MQIYTEPEAVEDLLLVQVASVAARLHQGLAMEAAIVGLQVLLLAIVAVAVGAPAVQVQPQLSEAWVLRVQLSLDTVATPKAQGVPSPVQVAIHIIHSQHLVHLH